MAAITIKNYAMAGSEVPYAIPNSSPPDNILAIAFQAVTTNISMYTTSAAGTVCWTLYAGLPGVTLQARDMAGQTIYFIAASGTLQVIEQRGLGS